jgi:hypothetical protein
MQTLFEHADGENPRNRFIDGNVGHLTEFTTESSA